MKWVVVRHGLTCMFGCRIGAGELAMVGRRPGIGVCELHSLEKYRETPPERSFGFSGDAAEDVRARQAGSDD